jgi:DNA repair protein SbcD/Mre11
MKIAIIADSHFTERSRWDECIRIHEWIAKDIRDRDIDLVLHSGDLFDAKSTPIERLAVSEWIREVTEHAPMVIVRGNHDAIGDIELMGKLKTNYPILVEEMAGVRLVSGVAVACLAWPRKAELLAQMQVSHEESEQVAKDALRSILLGFKQQFEQHDGPCILLTHAMVRGSRTTAGQPLVGCDLELGLDDLRLAGADFVALGHIHAHQAWGNESIVYPGSPRRTEFGDMDPKGYVVVEIGLDRYHNWRFVKTPATPMLDLDAVWDPVAGTLFGLHRLTDVSGAEIRLRYTVPVDARDAARARAQAWKTEALGRGAIVVKIEELVETTTRQRAPEIAKAKTLSDKLSAFWAAKCEDLGEREGVLLGKAEALEVEVAA